MNHKRPTPIARPRRWSHWLCWFVLLGSGCSHQPDIDDLRRGSIACPAAPETATKGAELVVIASWDAGCFYIDRHEVTRGEYRAFLEASGSPLSSDQICEWNASFEPACDDQLQITGTTPEHPVTCVDYCDAAAYCTWAGKTLCPGDAALYNYATDSTWYAACAGDERREYPYGASYDPERCNGKNNNLAGCNDAAHTCELVTAQQLTSCVTPEGVLHLSGNVDEWVDECDGSSGANDHCWVRGGAVSSDPGVLRCSGDTNRRDRDYRSSTLGFRCCVID